ncbi:MAG: protein phosphatase 2C domain-containing protein [Chloroflexi bacterium]|nr:protein phosphatase 2C domain-containing protein [Chloroflexota bacterium]MCY3583841.1 protein phosphatase 2C domain-containing protein [Chloroflexota bacterium]MCY3716227.1 protein phosphatase 2C domain-containing protein [Chloroflexota bacterium]MDE2650444.1 protein phosphatase 2C domain-containing protein [Chloroflexota bacterium]MXV93197.1 SpoIIE family protein phosphatase [Chloroflexota bacterium]
MRFIRRLFGWQGEQAEGDPRLQRASHVTPGRDQPIRPIDSEAEPDAPAEEHADESSPPPAPANEIDAQPAPQPPKPLPENPKPPSQPAPRRTVPEPPITEPSLNLQPKRNVQQQPLTYGIASHVGRLRSNNEDACFGMQWHSITVDERPDFGFFVVADGMGGHLDGERAAGIAVQTLAAEMLERVYTPMLRNFDANSSPTILDALVSAAESANRAVVQQVPGGGTTLSAVAIVGNLAYVAHVGDSRAYLVQGDIIEQLTTDHTLVQRLLQMQELTPEQAANYPQKNVLYRAIGQNEELKVERMIRTLPPGARIVICTDGLWDMVDDDTIGKVARTARTPQEACDRLVQLANEGGGIDNISVIVMKLPDAPSQD